MVLALADFGGDFEQVLGGLRGEREGLEGGDDVLGGDLCDEVTALDVVFAAFDVVLATLDVVDFAAFDVVLATFVVVFRMISEVT